jgi:hypothetical protein
MAARSPSPRTWSNASTNVMATLSNSGLTHPPRSNPRLRSSSRPPAVSLYHAVDGALCVGRQLHGFVVLSLIVVLLVMTVPRRGSLHRALLKNG